MKEKIQLLYIHGGMTFSKRENYLDFLKTREISLNKKKKWSDDYLSDNLNGFCQLIKPKMPLKENAVYEDWKINFERYLEIVEDNLILVGVSLGGIFLSKYLSENHISKNILSVYLVCPPFDGSISGEELAGGFDLRDDLSIIKQNCKNINFMFSKDDPIVPISHAEKYKEKITDANYIIYESKNGHFIVEEFPEIIDLIRKDILVYQNRYFS